MSSSARQEPEQTSRSSKESDRSKSVAEESNFEARDTLVEPGSKRSKLKSMLGMSSARASVASSSTASQSEPRRSSVSSAVAKLKDKVSGKGKGKAGMDELAGDEEEFEKLKQKEKKKEERKEEYERLGLEKKVKLGSAGMQIQ
jgi:hypothetical protein